MSNQGRVAATDAAEVLGTLAQWLGAVGASAPEEISRESRLAALDVDSLDLVEIAEHAHARWGVTLAVADVKDLERVGDFVDLVVERLP
jgi:acyl carrier protein